MTEPTAGSDLQAIRTTAVRADDGGWIINGSKTFITNGINSDVVIVVCRTDPTAGSRGLSLIVVERDTPGFTRGKKLEKLGLPAQDTAELFFDDVHVPGSNLLGREGAGFAHLMERLPQERNDGRAARAHRRTGRDRLDGRIHLRPNGIRAADRRIGRDVTGIR